MSDKKRKRSAVFFKISMKIEISFSFFSFLSETLFESVKKKIKIVFVVAVAVFFVVAVAVFFVVRMKIFFKK